MQTNLWSYNEMEMEVKQQHLPKSLLIMVLNDNEIDGKLGTSMQELSIAQADNATPRLKENAREKDCMAYLNNFIK